MRQKFSDAEREQLKGTLCGGLSSTSIDTLEKRVFSRRIADLTRVPSRPPSKDLKVVYSRLRTTSKDLLNQLQTLDPYTAKRLHFLRLMFLPALKRFIRHLDKIEMVKIRQGRQHSAYDWLVLAIVDVLRAQYGDDVEVRPRCGPLPAILDVVCISLEILLPQETGSESMIKHAWPKIEDRLNGLDDEIEEFA